MENTIVVLGGDGYYGWPIALKLAVAHPETRVVIADNEWRRTTVRAKGSDSLLPVPRLPQRIAAFRYIYGQKNLDHRFLDVNSEALDELLRRERPHSIYHLAQQSAAPYALLGPSESLYTIQNNEGGTMRLLWAVHKQVPNAHIIRFGPLDTYSNDAPYGVFDGAINGEALAGAQSRSQSPEDMGHISARNERNYLAMACRRWGLRVTELLQPTLFGVCSGEMLDCEELYTRFDHDDIFGTAINRLLARAATGHSLTVYPDGEQTTGIMPMKDAVASLDHIAANIPDPGAHHVLRQAPTAAGTMGALAACIRAVAESFGYPISTEDGSEPPLHSNDQQAEKETNEHQAFDLATSAVNDVLRETFGIIARQKERNRQHAFAQPAPLLPGAPAEQAAAPSDVQHAAAWEAFRENYFPSDCINLNPGTLGTTSVPVRNVRTEAPAMSVLNGGPLRLLEYGRSHLAEIRALCSELWPSEGYELIVGNGSSATLNLLALAMLRAFHRDRGGPIRVVTSQHEHPGALGVFTHLPEYEVHALDDNVLHDEAKLEAALARIRPQVALLSHVYYDSGNRSPFEPCARILSATAPHCKIILDASLSVGLYDLPFGSADVVVGSGHKWLFGPHGSSFTWLKHDFLEWIEGLYWNAVPLACEPQLARFCLQGGQDFLLYAEVLEALKLYRLVSKDVVLRRSAHLSDQLRRGLEELLTRYAVPHRFLSEAPGAPLLSVAFPGYYPFALYSGLSEKGVHCKCLIDHLRAGAKDPVLRFGVPYYETERRIEKAVAVMEELLLQQKATPMQAVEETRKEDALRAKENVNAHVAA